MLRIFIITTVLFWTFGLANALAQQPPADKGKDQKSAGTTKKSSGPKPFWKEKFPPVTGKLEKKYDIERDEIMQPHNTKIFLRDVRDEVLEKKSFNIQDSAILKQYDKNKDGIISNLELQEILKDLKEDE